MGGAYLNFELEIHKVRFILKILKKHHENQRKKPILTRYIYNKSKFHATTLFAIYTNLLVYKFIDWRLDVWLPSLRLSLSSEAVVNRNTVHTCCVIVPFFPRPLNVTWLTKRLEAVGRKERDMGDIQR
jgi:hypothetical protein